MADEIRKPLLAELIDAAKKFTAGEWDQDTMAQYGQSLTVRQYMPISEKKEVAISIITEKRYTETSLCEIKITELYKYLFFDGLLRYALVDSSNDSLKTDENYDLLFPIFNPFILSFCRDDYEVLVDLIKDSINMYNITDLVNVISNVDTESIENGIKSNRSMMEELTKNGEIMERLSDIAALNNPALNNVIKDLKESLLTDIKKDINKE